MRPLRMVTVPPPTQDPLRSTSTAVPGGSSGGSTLFLLFGPVTPLAGGDGDGPFPFDGGRNAPAAGIVRACAQAVEESEPMDGLRLCRLRRLN